MAKLASFIGMAEVLFAVLFAWLPHGQLPPPVQFLGGASILAGIVLVRASELRSDRAPATAEAHEDPEQARRAQTRVRTGRPLLWSRAGRAPEAGNSIG